jgi:hypothetical protein
VPVESGTAAEAPVEDAGVMEPTAPIAAAAVPAVDGPPADAAVPSGDPTPPADPTVTAAVADHTAGVPASPPVVGPGIPLLPRICAPPPSTIDRFIGRVTTASGSPDPSAAVRSAVPSNRPATSVVPSGAPAGVPLVPPVHLPAPLPAPMHSPAAPVGSSATATAGASGCGHGHTGHPDLPYAVLSGGVADGAAPASAGPAQGFTGSVVGGADHPGTRPG